MITRNVEIEIELTGDEFLDAICNLTTITLAHCSISIMTQLTNEKIKKIHDHMGNCDGYAEWVESAKQFAARLESSM